MNLKQLPTAKTAVFEFIISIADALRRNVVKSESVAHKTEAMRSGDILVSTTTPITSLGAAKSFVFIQSYLPVRIQLRQLDANGASVVTEILCNGVFMASSAFDDVSVALSASDERVFYCIG